MHNTAARSRGVYPHTATSPTRTGDQRYATIAALGPLIRQAELSPVWLTEQCLAQIEKLNPALNAFITVTADQARAAAQSFPAGPPLAPAASAELKPLAAPITLFHKPPTQGVNRMQKITTFLTFKDQAEDALKFYTSVFRNAKAGETQRYGDGAPCPKGSFMTGSFEIAGQTFFVLNAGADFGFAPGMSLFVDCPTQEEVDELWDKLSEGGSVQQCGWLQDKFGVSWQIVPSVMRKVLADKDPVKVNRVMQAMMQMVKLDAAKLQQAYEGA